MKRFSLETIVLSTKHNNKRNSFSKLKRFIKKTCFSYIGREVYNFCLAKIAYSITAYSKDRCRTHTNAERNDDEGKI